jgi:hypothetical protein
MSLLPLDSIREVVIRPEMVSEAQWLEFYNVRAMLRSLEGKVSERKLRLFCCAVAQNEWDDLIKESRALLEVSERYADRLTSRAELIAAAKKADAAVNEELKDIGRRDPEFYRWTAALQVSLASHPYSFDTVADAVYNDPLTYHIVRCIFGGVFQPSTLTEVCPDCKGTGLCRPPDRFLPQKCARCRSDGSVYQTTGQVWYNDGYVQKIAEGIYEDRCIPERTLDTGRFAMLHDALLDAGCTDEGLLRHCRAPGPHVRGCWVIDLLTGRV